MLWKFEMNSQSGELKSLPGFGFLPEYVIKENVNINILSFTQQFPVGLVLFLWTKVSKLLKED